MNQCVETDPRVKAHKQAWRNLKQLLKEERQRDKHQIGQEKTNHSHAKARRHTSSPIIARHLAQRRQGMFKDPKDELRVIDNFLDSDYLPTAERNWANRRRKTLLRRIQEPAARFQIMGMVPSGKMSEEDKQRFGDAIEMKKCVNMINKILQK